MHSKAFVTLFFSLFAASVHGASIAGLPKLPSNSANALPAAAGPANSVSGDLISNDALQGGALALGDSALSQGALDNDVIDSESSSSGIQVRRRFPTSLGHRDEQSLSWRCIALVLPRDYFYSGWHILKIDNRPDI